LATISVAAIPGFAIQAVLGKGVARLSLSRTRSRQNRDLALGVAADAASIAV
jgi:hypothetical protein